MNDKDTVPDGYEVKPDMYGFPRLVRKMTPEMKRLDRIAAVPFAVLIALVIWWLASL